MKPWQQTFAGFLMGLITVAAVLLIVSPQRGQPLALVTVTPNLTPQPTATPALIRVHVTGAVVSPGVYSLPDSSRVGDAIEAAGGLTESTNPQDINLAAILVDGQRVFIPDTQAETLIPGERSSNLAGSTLININTAGFAQLDLLPGIGQVKAQAILDYRHQNGLFTALEDLMKVEGISQSVFDRLIGLITLGD